ncbi:MAG: NAD(P)/FAD-dependent oxidoreductase [Myxococcota bacterium]
MYDPRPHVVILGGGFGGLAAARKLARASVRITLIDRRNHHLFQPLLYQVATAALNPSDIAYPIRSILRRQKNARVLLAEARHIDVKEKRITLDSGHLDYDYLIVATGATHSYFGNDSWAKHAPGLKSLEDALDIRRRVYVAYEAAERERDPDAQREWMTFAVVGAGPTGVELAGALTEIGKHTLSRDFRVIDPTSIRVVLIEGCDRVLPSYHESLSAKARTQLEQLGVEVVLGKYVTAIDDRGLTIGDTRIPARTVLWAAGVQVSPLVKSLGAPLDRAGRVEVERDLSIPGHPSVFVIGDAAHFEQDGETVPGVAQVALQGGKHVAACIVNTMRGRPRTDFRYNDKGSLATVGRAAAVAEVGQLRLAGLSAWLLWLGVHLMFLVGFRNRVSVFFSWAWSYVTFQRGARLITGYTPPLPEVANRASSELGQAAEVIALGDVRSSN